MKYRVGHHLKREGKEYGPGEVITLTEAEAQQCGSALTPINPDKFSEWAEKKAAKDAKKQADN